ncbi:MAG: hypothetical protein EOO12_10145 [Chitinophagaceae bacterium]|nr:MAG: hypothetical protein EOO12_10145 [Chitinophagaceae bacterium]
MDDLRGVNRKLQGHRPLPAKDPDQNEAGKKQYSIAQQSVISQAGHFHSLISRMAALAATARQMQTCRRTPSDVGSK